MSGRFFHTRHSIELLPENGGKFSLKPASRKRGALHEQTPSDINRNKGDTTIRLVGSSTHGKNHKQIQALPPSKHGYTIQTAQGSSSLYSSKVPNKQHNSAELVTERQANRFSTTSSAADTVLNDSLFSPTSCNFSLDGSARNTPTPIQQEEFESERLRQEALPPVVETSFESTTIRPVTASSSSGAGSHGSETIRREIAQLAAAARVTSVATLMSDSASSEPNIEVYGLSSPSRYSSSSPAHSGAPSFNVIRYDKSDESIAAVQYAQVRPPTAKSDHAASSVWSEGESESLPPLSVARKRSHMHSASAAAAPRLSNLSTIASESEPSSRSITRLPSDDVFTSPAAVASSSQSKSGNWYVRRQTMPSSEYSPAESSSDYQTMSAESSRWELERANSVLHQPMFTSSNKDEQSSSPMITNPSSEIPNSEKDDTIAELQSHPLRGRRSGPLLRGRAISEPRPASGSAPSSSTSINAPDRTSQGSSMFPQWAKSFYRGKLQFAHANESNASLAPQSPAYMPAGNITEQTIRMAPWPHHQRWESAGNSLMTLPMSPSEMSPPFSPSPLSSHFLPSIFRPYHMRSTTTSSFVTRSSSLAELYIDESRLDFSDSVRSSSHSMAINRVSSRTRGSSAPPISNHLPCRQHTVKSDHALPRDDTFSSSNYRQSNTASHMFSTPPCLSPSRRLSPGLSAWRAPSFDEAYRSLLLSRGNRQILFFCLGFLCPVLWMVASFLPLPARPVAPDMTANDDLESSFHDLPSADLDAEVDVGSGEKQQQQSRFARGLQVERMQWDAERKWLKARWWRNLNRIMSFVGVAMIGAIVALAVVATTSSAM